MKSLILPLTLALTLLLPMASHAAPTLYAYTGRPFDFVSADSPFIPGAYTAQMSVTGWLVLSEPLPANTSPRVVTPTAFSFTDGRFTYSSETSDLSLFFMVLETDSQGGLIGWNMAMERRDSDLTGDGTALWNTWGDCDSGHYGCFEYGEVSLQTSPPYGVREYAEAYRPGSWTIAPAVPEPSAQALLLAGLLLLVAAGPAGRAWATAGDASSGQRRRGWLAPDRHIDDSVTAAAAIAGPTGPRGPASGLH
ncbi:MAG: hypothetical protein KA387_03605 [Rubrivivax sp.]|nr:hypothetical protein [Rubrivivax sp.]